MTRGPGAVAMPKADTLRLSGRAAVHARDVAPPLGARFDEGARDVAVILGPEEAADVGALARALPAPDELPEGALVVVMPHVVTAPSLVGRVRSVLGRAPVAARAMRCSALVARGYTEVGGGVDPDGRADLAWGRVSGLRAGSR